MLFKMEGTCNECVFPLNKEESEGVCATDTSLTYTASKGKLSCVKELIAAGADVNVMATERCSQLLWKGVLTISMNLLFPAPR